MTSPKKKTLSLYLFNINFSLINYLLFRKKFFGKINVGEQMVLTTYTNL